MNQFIIVILLVISQFSYAQTVISSKGKAAGQIDSKKALKLIVDAQVQEKLEKEFLKETKDGVLKASRMLAIDLAPYVKTLKRDIITYNYRDRKFLDIKQGELIDVDSKIGVEYAEKWDGAIKTFLPKETGMLGWGLYSANDPVASASYGGNKDDFVMVEVKYPKSSKMLDLRKTEGEYLIPISMETQKYLKKVCGKEFKKRKKGWNNSFRSGFNPAKEENSYFNKVTFTRNETCHQIFLSALSSLQINGIIYGWGGANPMKACADNLQKRDNREVAFVSYNIDIDKESTKIFTKIPANLESKILEKGTDFLKTDIKGWTQKDTDAYEKFAVNLDQYYELADKYDKQYIYQSSVSVMMPTDEKRIEKYKEELINTTFGCHKKFEEDDDPTFEPMQAVEFILKNGIDNFDLSKDLHKSLEPFCN